MSASSLRGFCGRGCCDSTRRCRGDYDEELAELDRLIADWERLQAKTGEFSFALALQGLRARRQQILHEQMRATCRHWDAEGEACRVAAFVNSGVGETDLWDGCIAGRPCADAATPADCWRRRLADGEALPKE
jgi:hypothetical protein